MDKIPLQSLLLRVLPVFTYEPSKSKIHDILSRLPTRCKQMFSGPVFGSVFLVSALFYRVAVTRVEVTVLEEVLWTQYNTDYRLLEGTKITPCQNKRVRTATTPRNKLGPNDFWSSGIRSDTHLFCSDPWFDKLSFAGPG